MYTYGVIALAEKAVQRLSEADQEILAAELTASSKTLDTMARSDNLTAFTALESLGINIVQLVPEVRAAFEQEAAQATEKLIESGEIEQALYDRIVVVLDRIRNP